MKLIHLKPEDYPVVLAMGAINEGGYFVVPDHLPPEPFIPWLPTSLIQQIKPIKLTIELVPQTCWFSNIRSNISSMDWERIKKVTAGNTNHRCQICQGKGDRWPVECHEIWEYENHTLTQRLAGFIALCPPCHRVKHIGLSIKKNLGDEAIHHLAKINQWSIEKAQNYIQICFALWEYRSQFEWSLDINYMQRFGIRILKTDREYQPSIYNHILPENFLFNTQSNRSDSFLINIITKEFFI